MRCCEKIKNRKIEKLGTRDGRSNDKGIPFHMLDSLTKVVSLTQLAKEKKITK